MTYCATTDPKLKIQSFSEQVGKSPGLYGKITTASYEIRDSCGPVVFLETTKITQAGGESPDFALVAVHEDGEIRCLSADLSEQFWRFLPRSTSTASAVPSMKVLHAVMLGLDEARKGFLKNREDVLLKLQGIVEVSGSDSAAPDLLVVLTRSVIHRNKQNHEELAVRMYSVRGGKQPRTLAAKTNRLNVEEILTLPLPEADVRPRKNSAYFIHKISGTLYHCADKALRVYDFTALVPKLTSHIRLKKRIQSCVRVSSSTVIITTLASISIIDIKYQSFLATISVNLETEENGASPLSKKAITRRESTRLLSYSASSGTAVAIRGRSLVSYQTVNRIPSQFVGRKRSRSGKLVDAIGRGLGHQSPQPNVHEISTPFSDVFGEELPELSVDKVWEEVKAKLDVTVSENNVEEFDSSAIQGLGLDRANNEYDTVDQGAFEEPRQEKRVSRLKLIYLINKIMKTKNESPSADTTIPTLPCLSIKFLPSRTFHWLIRNNYFSTQFIESALKQSGELSLVSSLPVQAVVQALAAYDPSFRSLASLIKSSSFLSPREVIYAVRIAIEALKLQEIQGDQKLLTNGETNGIPALNPDAQMTNGASEHEWTSKAIDGTLRNVRLVIEHGLGRLHHCHESDIRKALGLELSPNGLLSFIDFLRIELARGGWFSRYTDNESLYHADQTQGNGINVTTKILNCAIDCLGAGAWIGNSSNTIMADNADTIAYMKAEVSAILEGIEEAAYLRGMLNEVLLYSKTVKTRHLEPAVNAADAAKPVTVVVQNWQDSLLPIGLKADQGAGLRKIGAGGEIQERSMRDVGRLKSKKVGPYSFERILI